MTTIEKNVQRQHVHAFRAQMRHFIMTSRFNNATLEENRGFRRQNPKIGCVYCSPSKIAEHVPIDSIMFILEMNNDTNRIEGIGMVKNHPYANKYAVYKNGNYNRYVYTGKHRIDRSTMTEEEEKIMTVFDVFCFTGNRHLKRGQGIKSFPPETLYRCSRTMDLVAFMANMFKRRIH